MSVDPEAHLRWPVFPHQPYLDAPETSLEHAVATLSVRLIGRPTPDSLIRPGEQVISFTIRSHVDGSRQSDAPGVDTY